VQLSPYTKFLPSATVLVLIDVDIELNVFQLVGYDTSLVVLKLNDVVVLPVFESVVVFIHEQS
jgi:hypothetical protein